MKAKDTLLLNKTITQNPVLVRRAWFWRVASQLMIMILLKRKIATQNPVLVRRAWFWRVASQLMIMILLKRKIATSYFKMA